MSAIAQAWVLTVKTGNQTAKQLLQFLASQNFGNPNLFFKTETLSEQLEVTPRAIQKAMKLLYEKNLIKKEPRYDASGRQLTNQVFVNVPPEFMAKFNLSCEPSSPKLKNRGEHGSPTGANMVRGEGEHSSPLNNNINNNINNKERARKKQRSTLPSDFYPSSSVLDKAEIVSKEVNISVNNLIEKFRLIQKRKEATSYDWDIDFELFLLNEKPAFMNAVAIKTKTTETGAYQEYGPGHPRWELLHGKNKIQSLI